MRKCEQKVATRLVDLRNAYEILVAKCKGQTPFGHTQEENMQLQVCVKEITCEDIDWPCKVGRIPTKWRVWTLRMEETASGYGGWP
jgi:hypothetical protein